MNRRRFALFATLLTWGCLTICSEADEREVVIPPTPSLQWYGDLDEALAAAKKSGKPILLEFR